MPSIDRERIDGLWARRRRARMIRNRAAAVAIVAGGYLTTAWSLMITAGIAHRDWWPLVPVMGFGTAFALTAVPMTVILLASLVIELLN